MTDFRTLCADLLQEFASLYSEMSARVDFNETYTERVDKLLDRTSTALAQSEPEGPADEDLRALWRLGWQSKDPEDGAVLFAREVLARWSRPANKPVPVAERPWEREGWCDKYGMCWRFDPCDRGWWSYGPILPSDGNPAPFTYLLPHHALAVPTTH